MSEAILINNTAKTSVTTIPATDGIISTDNIKPTLYNFVRTHVLIELNSTGTSLLANIAFKLKLNGGTLTQVNYRLPAAAVGTHDVEIEYVGDMSVGGALTVTAATAVSDANTTLTVKHVYVTAVT